MSRGNHISAIHYVIDETRCSLHAGGIMPAMSVVFYPQPDPFLFKRAPSERLIKGMWSEVYQSQDIDSSKNLLSAKRMCLEDQTHTPHSGTPDTSLVELRPVNFFESLRATQPHATRPPTPMTTGAHKVRRHTGLRKQLHSMLR